MRLYMIGIGIVSLYASALFAETESAKDAFRRPLTIPFPEDAPYRYEVATLGKMLFFDPRLSGAQNMSCASCHNPSFGWEAPVETAVGAANTRLGRHAPTIVNGAWVSSFFWDGRADSLEEQAAGPITAAVEMNATFDQVVNRLSEVDEYVEWFDLLFPSTGISEDNILSAIAMYERTVVSGWSRFDRWVDGDDEALTAQETRGFELFIGEAQCSQCHMGWNMTDNAFHDIGLNTDDIGRAALEPHNPTTSYAFKTPGLRNIALRAPYMHDGQLGTLEDVLRHYASGGIDRPSRSPFMSSFTLSQSNIEDVVAFLGTLTEEKTDVPTPILPAN